MERAGTFAYWRGRILAAIRRWLVPVIAAGAVGGLVAFLVGQTIAPEYRATAQLFLTPGSSPSGSFQDVALGQSLARNYVHLVKAEGVLRSAMDKTGWDGDIERFRERTQVAQVSDTSIINLSFRDRDPQRAADAANAIATAFIEQTQTLEANLQGTTASQLDEQIKSVETDIRGLDEQIAPLRAATVASAPPGEESAQAEQQARLLTLDGLRQSKQQTLAQLVRARDDIRLSAARSRNTLSLWQSAIAPRRPDTPNVPLNVVLGTLSGSLLALLAIGIVRYRDDRLTDLDVTAERLGVAALAEIPLGRRPGSLAGKLFVRDEPQSPEAEAFRSLRTNIIFADVDRRPRTVLLTSAVPLEGKSVVSANLALAFADAGTPTVLIDADLRRPSQHALFGVDPNPGLSNLLTGDLAADAIPQMQVSPNLIVIPSGSLPANPAEALSSSRMSALIDDLSSRTKDGAVIIDGSPLLTVADAAALATQVDGCVIVVDSGRTHARVAQRAIEVLRRVRAPILGVVLNKTTGREAAYHYEHAKAASGPRQAGAAVD
jgi:capsular exopolysaccharide synthesis family protein